MRPMQNSQYTGIRDKIPIPYHSIHSLPNLTLVYFYNLYFLHPRGNATTLVELANFCDILNICAIFHMPSWNTFLLVNIYNLIFPSSFISPGNNRPLGGAGVCTFIQTCSNKICQPQYPFSQPWGNRSEYVND